MQLHHIWVSFSCYRSLLVKWLCSPFVPNKKEIWYLVVLLFFVITYFWCNWCRHILLSIVVWCMSCLIVIMVTSNRRAAWNSLCVSFSLAFNLTSNSLVYSSACSFSCFDPVNVSCSSSLNVAIVSWNSDWVMMFTTVTVFCCFYLVLVETPIYCLNRIEQYSCVLFGEEWKHSLSQHPSLILSIALLYRKLKYGFDIL